MKEIGEWKVGCFVSIIFDKGDERIILISIFSFIANISDENIIWICCKTEWDCSNKDQFESNIEREIFEISIKNI